MDVIYAGGKATFFVVMLFTIATDGFNQDLAVLGVGAVLILALKEVRNIVELALKKKQARDFQGLRAGDMAPEAWELKMRSIAETANEPILVLLREHNDKEIKVLERIEEAIRTRQSRAASNGF